MNTAEIIALLGVLFGSSGLTAVLTTLFNRKKFHEEGIKVKQDREIELDKYVNDKLKNVTDMYINETKELKESNRALQLQINELQNRLQELMCWIVNDNATNIEFLKSKVREFDPEFEFPEMKPYPNPFMQDSDKT